MDCEGAVLTRWTARWEDLIAFDVIPVATLAEAAAEVATRLRRRASPRHVRGVDAGNLEFPGSAY